VGASTVGGVDELIVEDDGGGRKQAPVGVVAERGGPGFERSLTTFPSHASWPTTNRRLQLQDRLLPGRRSARRCRQTG
jgi:hypothetical protein